MDAHAKIMVVDDEGRICENVKKILSQNNYKVVQAFSAQEALEKMARESFSLLISDIVMPGMNGLELLKLIKTQWPLTKAIMMTAYASTETAARAIRLGALDYLPKPFTPDELRTMVERALAGELVEAAPSKRERGRIKVETETETPKRRIIDVDVPFDRDEVAKYAGEDYAKKLGPSDMPSAETTGVESLKDYCKLGKRVCSMFEKLGSMCKVGVKTGECPQAKAEKKRRAGKASSFDGRKLIGIDMPFIYDDVVSITGPEYISHLNRDGMAFVPFADVKRRFEQQQAEAVAERSYVIPKAASDGRILIVEDEVAVNNNIRKIFDKMGYEVEQALSKETALRKIEKRFYDLVLLDLRIPGVEGLELLAAIRELQPDARVIIITGYASIETAVETARLGAVDYLAKPFTPDEIRSAADRVFRAAA